MTNPLVAEREDSTKSFSGVPILESIDETKKAIESGDWASGVMGAVGTGLDALSMALDPFGSILAAGVGWLMEHVGPLSDALDALTGDADQIKAHSETWKNVAAELGEINTEMASLVSSDTANWVGAAGDAYRKQSEDTGKLIEAAQKAAEGASEGVGTAGEVVAAVRTLVRDIIADLVGSLISWALQVLATLGLAMAWVVPQVVAAVAKTVAKIADVTTKLVKAMKSLGKLMKKLGDGFGDAKKALDKIKKNKGGSGNKPDSPAPTRSTGNGDTPRSGPGGDVPRSGPASTRSMGNEDAPRSGPGGDTPRSGAPQGAWGQGPPRPQGAWGQGPPRPQGGNRPAQTNAANANPPANNPPANNPPANNPPANNPPANNPPANNGAQNNPPANQPPPWRPPTLVTPRPPGREGRIPNHVHNHSARGEYHQYGPVETVSGGHVRQNDIVTPNPDPNRFGNGVSNSNYTGNNIENLQNPKIDFGQHGQMDKTQSDNSGLFPPGMNDRQTAQVANTAWNNGGTRYGSYPPGPTGSFYNDVRINGGPYDGRTITIEGNYRTNQQGLKVPTNYYATGMN
ncbi:hypothetical protein SAMN05421805_103430 [Saccharopolyspora antimicrobica]|uniref:WXG100 family type VII secretion target n=1 Tax=Saccharopolyspora antimicrobica TaxID=455193 RepID=A0A1I4XG41_9PSEU|nr:hypothetical protein ATL45_2814 [Saccharopolyspora antimicrobica]SFN24878.1 hypothetical protein SAMN05421805_103430 [Saccharopolyspora antimicrobica]